MRGLEVRKTSKLHKISDEHFLMYLMKQPSAHDCQDRSVNPFLLLLVLMFGLGKSSGSGIASDFRFWICQFASCLIESKPLAELRLYLHLSVETAAELAARAFTMIA